MTILTYIISDTERASKRCLKTLSFVPDDKLQFTPGSHAMSVREIAAHLAIVNTAYVAYLHGKPRVYSSFEELFNLSKEAGARYSSTAVLVDDLKSSFETLLGDLKGLSPDIITRDVQTVRGTEKAQSLLERLAPHIWAHTGQIDYLQTIWGDTEVHM